MNKSDNVVLIQNSKLQIQSNEVGVKLRDTECTIEIKYSGICSSDIFRGFDNGAYFYPLVMGHEFSGIISKTGAKVSNFTVGDRVGVFPLLPCFKCDSCISQNYQQCSNYKYYGSRNHGGFAKYLNVENWNLIKIPKEIDLKDACLLEPMSVVVHGLKKLKLLKSNTKSTEILIIGCGFLTFVMLELLEKFNPNSKIIAIDRNQHKLDKISNVNVETFLLDSEKKWNEFVDIKGSKFDYVIEMSGAPINYSNTIKTCKHGGVILWISNINDNLKLDKKEVSQILRKELKLLGSWNSSYKKENDDDWKLCLSLIKEHNIKPSKFITNLISLNKVPEYLNSMYNHKTNKNKFNYIKVCVKN